MAKIIEKHDNDEVYIFTCPVCGTKFTERERKIYRSNYTQLVYSTRCPNCSVTSDYYGLEGYNKTETKD